MSGSKIVVVNFEKKENPSKNGNKLLGDDPLSAKYLNKSEIIKIMNSIGDISYYWDIKSGVINYSDNIYQIAEHINVQSIKTTDGFDRCLDVENVLSRYESIHHSMETDDGSGVEYRVDYRLVNDEDSHQGYWIEDKGRWFADSHGKPESACGIMRVMNRRHYEQQELALLGTHDSLTSLVNRIQLQEKLKHAVETIVKTRRNGAFLLVGIDNLAMINESYGLDVADEVICLVAKRISRLLRKTDIVGRYSGNKFGIILNDCDEKHITIAAQRVIDAIGHDVIKTKSEAVSVTVSAGAVSIPIHSISPQDIMQFAEETLSLAKIRPIESFSVYRPSLKRENYRKNNIMIAGEVVSALNDRRVRVAYQPLVHADTGIVESYECLLRIVGRDGVLIPNAEMIPVAEKLNLMRLLDNRVLEIALEKLRIEPHIHLAVNISGGTIADSTWLDCLIAGVDNNRSIGKRLTIEITETALLCDIGYTNDFVNTLHDLGCLVSIDDFGAGYTSFQNLKLLDVDTVKIDGTFIQNLQVSEDDEFFIKTMNDLAKHFSISTVAEWVESEEDVITLRNIGINYLQGFYFGQGEYDILTPNSGNDVVLGKMYQDKMPEEASTETIDVIGDQPMRKISD